MQLTKCRICGEHCLAGVGICSRCARRVERDILLIIAASVAVFVCAVTWILVELYG